MKTLYSNTHQTSNGVIRNPDGTPFDLTNCTVEFFIRSAKCMYLYISSAGSGVSLEAPKTTGAYTVRFRPVDTINIPTGIYHYGIIVKNCDNEMMFVGGGSIKLENAGTE